MNLSKFFKKANKPMGLALGGGGGGGGGKKFCQI